MSRTELRTLLAIAASAFALRAGAAVLTEYRPLFPSYYYTDAQFADREARKLLGLIDEPPATSSLSHRAHAAFTALIYRASGPRPLAPKLVNALAASLGVLAFGVFACGIFGFRAGAASAGLLTLWPSHVFFTSQNFKEGLVCGALMGAWLLLAPAGKRREPRAAAAGLALLGLLGALRAPVMLAAAAVFVHPRLGRRGLAALLLVACLAVPLVFRAAPAAITEYRRSRQHSESLYALSNGREVGTFLFPDEKMSSWLDVLAFIPKASFHVLFMPLPGLFPMEGKPGRMLAAAENAVLLALVLLASAAALRLGPAPALLAPLLFFAAMTLGSSVMELDLGGASRHKLMYCPMLFPFAVDEFFRLTGRGRRS